MGSGQKPKTEQQIIEYATEQAVKRVKQLQKKPNVPQGTELDCTATRSEIADRVQKAYILFTRPHATTDEMVCEAFNWYFQEYLPKTGAYPTLEGLALSCGVDRRTLTDWKNGHLSDTRSAIVKKAIGVLAELDAQLVQAGKIPQVVYIFRSKNFYGMQDAVKVEMETNSDTIETPEEIERKIRDAIPVDCAETGTENGTES